MLLILAPPAGLGRAAVIEEIVAKVNNRIITKSEFEERGEAMLRQVYQNYHGADLDEKLRLAQEGLLANLITENLLLERASTIFDIDKIRKTLIEDFRKQQKIETDRDLEKLLVEQDMRRPELEEQLIRMAVPQEIINYDVKRKISVSDREIRAWYERHLKDFETPATVTFREIVLLYEPDRRSEVEAKAEEIGREAQGDAPFVDLVARHSEAGTRESGGLLGPLPEGDLNPAIAAAAFALDPGQTSRPIDTGKSFHILRAEAKTEKVRRPIEAVRDEVSDAVRQEKFTPRYDAYIRKLWKDSQVEVTPKYEQFLVASPLKPKPAGA